MKSTILSFCIIALVSCDQQKRPPSANPPSASEHSAEDQQTQWELADTKRKLAAKERDRSISVVRSDLATAWTSLVVAVSFDDGCTSRQYSGFRIARENDVFTVAPWSGWDGGEKVGDAVALGKAAVNQLISETALYYLAATLSVDPRETMGRRPDDPVRGAEWQKERDAAWGSQLGSFPSWVEIRIASSDGVKKHSNWIAKDFPADFGRWITAFGTVK